MACARVGPVSGQLPPIEEMDWPFLVARAHHHGVFPLLTRRLAQDGNGRLTPDQRREIETGLRVHVARNLRITRELVELVEQLESRGIPVIPFKGPALAIQAYGDVGMRQFDDLDVFVRRADLPAAAETVRSLGYRDREPLDRALGAHLRTDKHLSFVSDTRAPLDLHWDVNPVRDRLPILEPSVWESPVRVAIGGFSVRALPQDLLVLSLCLHGARHSWLRLGWIADLAHLFDSTGFSRWDALRRKARDIGALRLLHLGLTLAGEVCAARVPEELLVDARRDRLTSSLIREARIGLFDDRPRDTLDYAWFDMRARGPLRNQIRFALSLTFEPRACDLRTVTLPRALGFLYYLLRPCRLAFRFAALGVTRSFGRARLSLRKRIVRGA